jgi:hypothetical protein
VYSACQGRLYGKEDQTLLINDEWSKALWNSKSSVFKKNVIEDISCPRIRCNGWTLLCDCGQHWFDYFLQVQFKCIFRLSSSFLSHVWVPVPLIILGSCNTWKTIRGIAEFFKFL